MSSWSNLTLFVCRRNKLHLTKCSQQTYLSQWIIRIKCLMHVRAHFDWITLFCIHVTSEVRIYVWNKHNQTGETSAYKCGYNGARSPAHSVHLVLNHFNPTPPQSLQVGLRAPSWGSCSSPQTFSEIWLLNFQKIDFRCFMDDTKLFLFRKSNCTPPHSPPV